MPKVEVTLFIYFLNQFLGTSCMVLTVGEHLRELSSRNSCFASPVFPGALLHGSVQSPPKLWCFLQWGPRMPALLPWDSTQHIFQSCTPSKLAHAPKKPGRFQAKGSLINQEFFTEWLRLKLDDL